MVYYLDGEVWLLLRGEEPVLLRLGTEVSEQKSGDLNSGKVRPGSTRSGKRQACQLPEK
jgi:hypothetical protein